jgi:hypothetical protein
LVTYKPNVKAIRVKIETASVQAVFFGPLFDQH